MTRNDPPVTPLVFQHSAICTRKPKQGERIDGTCPDCAHAQFGHVGVPGCAVCRLVSAATQFEKWARISSHRLAARTSGTEHQ